MAATQKTDEAFELALKEPYCRRCPAFLLNICRAGIDAFGSGKTAASPKVEQTGWSVLARRLICRDQDLSDVVPVICNGWATWYINVPHGGRQIISFILPGELARAALVFDPIQYCCIDAITDCQFRTLKGTN
ncbi:MAG: hypothetical protein P8Y53_19510 [Pseudolabrys sp.]|jgi:hypothetical protein